MTGKNKSSLHGEVKIYIFFYTEFRNSVKVQVYGLGRQETTIFWMVFGLKEMKKVDDHITF